MRRVSGRTKARRRTFEKAPEYIRRFAHKAWMGGKGGDRTLQPLRFASGLQRRAKVRRRYCKWAQEKIKTLYEIDVSHVRVRVCLRFVLGLSRQSQRNLIRNKLRNGNRPVMRIYPPSVTFGRRKCRCPEWNPFSEKSLPVLPPVAAASTTTGSEAEPQGEVLCTVWT